METILTPRQLGSPMSGYDDIPYRRFRRIKERAVGNAGAVDEGLAKLNEDIARLEAKLLEAKARQKSLLTRHKTANTRLAARKKIHDYQIDDAMIRFEQYTQRIDDVESRIEAYDLGLPKDLKHEFAGLEAEESIAREFDALKKRVSKESDPSAGVE